MHTRAFKNLFSSRPARRRGRKPAPRFSLEQLEPRTLLSVLFTDNFNNDSGGSVVGGGGGTIGPSSDPGELSCVGAVTLVPNSGPAGAGDTSVQISYQEPGATGYSQVGYNLAANLGDASEYYVQYYVKLDPNITGGMKFLKFFGQHATVNGTDAYANTTFIDNYWSDMLQDISYGPGTGLENDSNTYTTYTGTTANGEPNIQYTATSAHPINIADGNWHLIQVHVKYDTSFAAADGAYDVWIDGVHVLGITGITNRSDQDPNIWNFVHWGDYTSDPQFNPADGPFSVSIDDVQIANSYITGTAPSAPTGLSATAGTSQVALSWTGVSGAYSYNVFRGTSAGGESLTPVAFGVTGTSWTDTSVVNGTTYYYKVTAVNTGGQSGNSSEAHATPAGSVAGFTLVSPQPASASTLNNGPYTLGNLFTVGSTNEVVTALGAQGVSSYDAVPWANGTFSNNAVQVGIWNGTGTTLLASTTVTSTDPLSADGYRYQTLSTPITLVAGQQYLIGALIGNDIQGYADAGSSAWANLNSAFTLNNDTIHSGATLTAPTTNGTENIGRWAPANFLFGAQAAPFAPSGLAATAGTGPIGLTWNADSGAATYNVYRGTTPGREDTTPLATGISTTSWTDNTAVTGTTYYYEVTGVSSSGQSGRSNEVFATAIAAPTGLLASPDNDQAILTWTGVAGAATYNVYRGTTPGGEGATPVATGITNITWTDNSVTNGTEYYYEVTGVNLSGESNKSNEVSVTPHIILPAAPTGVMAAAGTSQIGLTWSTDAGAITYNVYRGTTPGGEGGTPFATGISTTSWTDNTAANGTAYYYEVTGVNAGGEGVKSSEVSATAIALPTGLSAGVGNGQITLTWTSAVGASTYDVYRGTSPGGEGATPVATGVSATTWNDTSAISGTTYYYEVTGVNSSGQGNKSNETSATASGLTLDVIGTPPAGTPTASYSAGTWTLTSSGMIDNSASDKSGFAAQTVSPNTSGAVITEITSNSVSTYAYGGGIMWRDGASATAATNVYVGWNYGYGVWMRDRVTAGTSGALLKQVTGVSLPVWVKLVCNAQGSNNYTFTGYYSTDGTNWILLATTDTIAMTNPMAGLTVLTSLTAQTADTVTFANLAIGVPAAPIGLAAAAGTAQIGLTWSADSGAATYNVYRGTTPGGESGTPVATGISATNWTDNTAVDGTTYYYEVTGVNAVGEGGKSSEASATAIAVPGNLQATGGTNQVSLTWSSAAGASTYDVYRGSTPGGEGGTPYATGISTTSWTDTSVTSGTTYYYQVTGVNSSGQGGDSNEASAASLSLVLDVIGTPPAGTPSLSYSAGTWTLTSSGFVDNSASDKSGFAAESTPANTSGVLYTEITSNSGNSYAFGGGIMWRDGVSATAATNVYVGWNWGYGIWMRDRVTPGTAGALLKQVTGVSLPVWVELVCNAQGNNNYTFSGYYSTDGTNWILLATTGTITMTNPMAGLTVLTSLTAQTANTVTFTNFDPHPLSGGTSAPNPISDHWAQLGSAGIIHFGDSPYLAGLVVNSDDTSALSIASVVLTPYLSAGWTDQNLGTVMPGWTAGSNGNFAVTGAGSDIGGTSDPFNFSSDSVTGDQAIDAGGAAPTYFSLDIYEL